MNEAKQQYTETADELTNRILALIPGNLKILEMKSAWDLFEIKGFKCSDLAPSLFQASWALGNAQRAFRNEAQTRTKGDNER